MSGDLEPLLDLLYAVIAHGRAIDEQPRCFATEAPLSRAEIHTVSAVATRPGIGVTELADQQGVTKGAASQMATRLVDKGLLRKVRAEGGREVALFPTALGERAHRAHLELHARMARALAAVYADPALIAEDTAALGRLLAAMRAFDAEGA